MNELPKIIAFHLPQFHEIPENNEWWGKGFTDWTNVKRAFPLYNNHNQPRIPLNSNYYDLSNVEVMKWQAEIANKFGIDGFCFYHYWFNGKKLLQKPIENFLKSEIQNIEYCLCWANEPWTKAWDGKERDVLIPQSYEDDGDWKNHFEYLEQFFQDKRYIKIDNKPVFVIYRSPSIPNCDEKLEYWNNLAKSKGFNGIYFINMMTTFQIDKNSKNFEGQILFEPMYTVSHDMGIFRRILKIIRIKLTHLMNLKSKIFINRIPYDYIWKRILKRKDSEKKTFLGAFPGWDNSPRKKNRCLIINGSNPVKFKKYLKTQYQKSISLNNEFLFINAWNEWAEGTYLEPDSTDNYKYLEAIKHIKDSVN